jgi:hypothetical protein
MYSSDVQSLAETRASSPLRVCAVTRRRFPAGVRPARQPLQPEATGAAMEVTKWLKPSESVSRIGDSASVQAATRVNAEQTSKRTMCRPTRQPYRGRLTWGGSSQGGDSSAHEQYSSSFFGIQGLSSIARSGSFPRQIKLTSGRRAKRLHQYPACGSGAQEGRDHSETRLFRPCLPAVRPPGSARTDRVLEDFSSLSVII